MRSATTLHRGGGSSHWPFQRPFVAFAMLSLLLAMWMAAVTGRHSHLALAQPDHSSGVAGSSNPADQSITLFVPLALGGNPAGTTGTLEDGASLRSPEGVTLGAVSGTLAAPIEATITPLTASPTPRPSDWTQEGGYYQVSAERLAIAPADKPFLIGLPVPPGAKTDELAMAILLPPKTVLDGPDDEPLWTLAAGHYDAGSELFVITLTMLRPEPLVVTLVADPAFKPIPVSLTSSDPARATGNTPSFEIFCYVPAFSCTEFNKAWLVGALQAAYNDFVNVHNFEPPALKDEYGYFDDVLDWLPVLEASPLYSGISIKDRPCPDGEDGSYAPITKEVVICLHSDPNVAPDANAVRTVRHELFHAIQHAYPNLHEDTITHREDTLWVIEGTATTAENSSLTMARYDDHSLFPVTTPITSTVGLLPYAAQDFWVYTGIESQENLAYLRSIFAVGGTPAHVNQARPLYVPFWTWAKNQAIEHHETMGGAFDVAPCIIEIDAVDLTNMPRLNIDTTYFVEGVLPPLTSALVEIEAPTGRLRLYVNAHNDENSPNMRFKVYEQGEANCRDNPDGVRWLENIPAGGLRYVLLTNVGVTEPLHYRVVID